MKLRDEIMVRLERLGWSQSELARRSGVMRPKINAYLNGGGLSVPNLDKLLAAMGARCVRWGRKPTT